MRPPAAAPRAALADLPAAISGRVSFLPLRPDPVSPGAESTTDADDWPEGVLRASDLVLCDGADLADLPKNCRAYVNRIEELAGVPVASISVGPDRDQTIIVSNMLG